MNIRCVHNGCENLSNTLYAAPQYDANFAVFLCKVHGAGQKVFEVVPNIVQEDGVTKVICYNCHFKWVPLTLEYTKKDKDWGDAGSMAGKKYGDLPLRCSACRTLYWNNPHISKKQSQELARQQMNQLRVNSP